MTILGKGTIPWTSTGYIPTKTARVYRIPARPTTRYARYLGNQKWKKRRLKYKVRKYLNN